MTETAQEFYHPRPSVSHHLVRSTASPTVTDVRYDYTEGPVPAPLPFVCWREDREPRSRTYEQLERPANRTANFNLADVA